MASPSKIGVILLIAVSSWTYADIPHLRDLAAKLDIFVGSAAGVSKITSSDDSEYNATLKDQFSLITPENGCKWAATEPQEGKFNFRDCDVIFNTSRQYNQAFRGHNLCWGVFNPNWLNGLAGNRSRLEAVLKQHIMEVASRYRGKAYAWDVVNEAVSDNPQGTKYLKTNIWYPTVPNYVDIAFQAASAADPSAKLFYNDYAAEGINAKSNAIYNMVKSMVDRGIPIHGIGLQAHLSLEGSNHSSEYKLSVAPPYDEIVLNVKRFADLGLEVHFTELDVSMKGAKGSETEKLQGQADIYTRILKACLSNSRCKNYEVWGFTDKYSWLGSQNQPDLFNVDYQPKPCFNAVVDVLNKSATAT